MDDIQAIAIIVLVIAALIFSFTGHSHWTEILLAVLLAKLGIEAYRRRGKKK